ncbi:hypothetical protein ABPG74_020573 [Tetrahymena malaccensis]
MNQSAQVIGLSYNNLQYSSNPYQSLIKPDQINGNTLSYAEQNQQYNSQMQANSLSQVAPVTQKPDIYGVQSYNYVTNSQFNSEKPRGVIMSEYSTFNTQNQPTQQINQNQATSDAIPIVASAQFTLNQNQLNQYPQSDLDQWKPKNSMHQQVNKSPLKGNTAANNGLSPYLSTNQQPYFVTQIEENSFESILNGKNNEIEYWKQKCTKVQKQLEDSDVKLNYLSIQYDNLRSQYLTLQESLDSQKLVLQQEKEMIIKSQQQQNATLNDMYTKATNDYAAINQQKIEQDLKISELQSQIQDLQLKNQNIEQDEVIKRAARPIFENKHSATSSRVVVVDTHQRQGGSMQNESEIVKAQFEMIDRQNSLIEYQKQQIMEKDQRIANLQQQLWDLQEMVNSSKGKSVFC